MSLLDSHFKLSCDSENQELRSMSSFDVEVEDQNDITGEHKDSIRNFNQKRGGVGKRWQTFCQWTMFENSEQEEEKNWELKAGVSMS